LAIVIGIAAWKNFTGQGGIFPGLAKLTHDVFVFLTAKSETNAEFIFALLFGKKAGC